MMKGKKIFACLALVSTLVVHNIFATSGFGLGSSTSDVKVGNVQDSEIKYNIDLEWGTLVFDFVKKESEQGETYYEWMPNTEGANVIKVTNKSDVMVNADVDFISSIPSVSGYFESGCNGEVYTNGYSLLEEEPADFKTAGRYFEIDESRNFIPVSESSVFESGKYCAFMGAGGGIATGPLPGYTNENGEITVSAAQWNLLLQGGKISDVKSGALIGRVTVKIS